MRNKTLLTIVLLVIGIFLFQPSNTRAKSLLQSGGDDSKCDIVKGIPIVGSLPSFGSIFPSACNWSVFQACSLLNVTPVVPAFDDARAALVIVKPGYNFQWNPTDPLTTGNDSTLTVVNVDTWFKFSPPLKEKGGVVSGYAFCGGIVTGWVTWKPKDLGFSCFGDYTGPTPLLKDYPWCHKYQYSSYNQPAKAANGDPAFQAYVPTFWEVDGWWIGWGPPCTPLPIPCPCDMNFNYKIPVYPLCEKKKVPVRQVVSVLVPNPWLGIPYKAP